MALDPYLLSTLVTGAVVVAVVLGISRLRQWSRYRPGPDRRERSGGWSAAGSRTLSGLAADQRAWEVAFLVLAIGFGAGAVLAVSGAAVDGLVLVGLVFLLVSVYLFSGVYLASRSRGRPSARAVAETVGVFALLFLVAVVVRLVASG